MQRSKTLLSKLEKGETVLETVDGTELYIQALVHGLIFGLMYIIWFTTLE